MVSPVVGDQKIDRRQEIFRTHAVSDSSPCSPLKATPDVEQTHMMQMFLQLVTIFGMPLSKIFSKYEVWPCKHLKQTPQETNKPTIWNGLQLVCVVFFALFLAALVSVDHQYLSKNCSGPVIYTAVFKTPGKLKTSMLVLWLDFRLLG